jgi:hypothetical protein
MVVDGLKWMNYIQKTCHSHDYSVSDIQIATDGQPTGRMCWLVCLATGDKDN